MQVGRLILIEEQVIIQRGNMPTGIRLGYLAGIIDGEGSVCANWVRDKRKEKYTTPNYTGIQVSIHLSNTSKPLMDRAQRIYQELAFRKFKIGTNMGHSRRRAKLIYAMVVTSQRAVEHVLEALIPHLTVKRSQAECMVKWIKSRKENKHHKKEYTFEEKCLVNDIKNLRRLEYDPLPDGGVQTERPSPIYMSPREDKGWMMLQSAPGVTRSDDTHMCIQNIA